MSAFVLKLVKLICSFLSYHPQVETNKNLPSMPTPPPDVKSNPIALLDCLEKNADGITEQDSKGTAFLHVVPIGKPRPQLEAILGISALGTVL